MSVARASMLLVLAASALGASAQDYPIKPIRVVTGSAGGGQDFAVRIIAQGIAGPLGQPLIIDNRGGSGTIAAEIVAKAPPDGHTVLFAASPHWLLPLMQDVPYDPVKDFSPVTLTLRLPNLVVVHPAVPANSIKELIALAKAKPGALNYGSSGTGASTHLAAELFKAMAGVNIVRIPYKGGGPTLNALLAGDVQMWFPNVTAAAPQVKAGKLRALAITSATPSPLTPGLPPVAASVPGYEAVSIMGMFVQAKTAATAVNRLNQEVVRIIHAPEVKERLLNTGAEPVGSSPVEFAAAIKTEMTRWGKVIRDAGIKAE